MIIHLRNNEVDRNKWDNCVKNTPGTKPYGYSWYLDIMAPGWEALIDDDYRSVFPLPGLKKFGLSYLSTPAFTQRLGVYSHGAVKPDSIDEFIKMIPRHFRLIDLCVTQEVKNADFRITSKTNFELDLSPEYNKLRNNFTYHCKRNIDISAKKKNDLVYDADPSELINLFRSNKGMEISELKDRHYARLDKLMSYCIRNHRGKIIGVRDAVGRLIFGIFLVEADSHKIMLVVVNTRESRDKRIGYFAVNEIIREHAGSQFILDFEGSSIPSVASFMESFGCRNIPYYRIYRNRLPWLIRRFKQGNKA